MAFEKLLKIVDGPGMAMATHLLSEKERGLANDVFKAVCGKITLELGFEHANPQPAVLNDPYFDSMLYFTKNKFEFQVLVRMPIKHLHSSGIVEAMAMQAFDRMGKQDNWRRIGDDKYRGDDVVCE